jgi:hypothetical protein
MRWEHQYVKATKAPRFKVRNMQHAVGATEEISER